MSDVDDALERQLWPAPRRAKGRAPRVALFEAAKLLQSSARANGGAHSGVSTPGALLREEVRAHVRQAPQVLVKITGASRGVAGITAHLDYIGDKGRREIEDQAGERHRSREEVADLRDLWRDSGARLPWSGERKEAHHVLFQMPAETPADRLQDAVRAFARAEFDGHLYAMALHVHQSTPHVHLIVRTEDVDGRRLNPRKADLHRWRMRFAHELRERGVDAAASRQRTRGYAQRHEQLWEQKLAQREAALHQRAARADALGDLVQAEQLRAKASALRQAPATRQRPESETTRRQMIQAEAGWRAVQSALGRSSAADDRVLAAEVARLLAGGRSPTQERVEDLRPR